ncbi:MAG: 16S rRNA (guanine(966)-N(2))-methyltransferase RsmD [Bdellovibrionota bacterium]
MRIIAGKYKRKKLVTLAGSDITRPTSDRVKESVFNILQDKIADICVLDLYSGCGALGFEALSRGAKNIILVEENKCAIDCIKMNLNSLHLEKDNCQIFHGKVSEFLNPLKNHSKNLKGKVDLIFADPPYNTAWYTNALKEIEASGICHNKCLVVLEMPLQANVLAGEKWLQVENRKYGKTKIEIWSRECEEI